LPPTTPTLRPRRVPVFALVTALISVVALGATGCSSNDSSTPSAEPPVSSVSGDSAPMASKVVIGTVAGTIRKPYRARFAAHRERFEKQVGAAVDGWLDGGFVGVSYPRSSFPEAFRTFTPDAAEDAAHDKRLMTLWTYRTRIDGVTTVHRSIAVDVLAPKGRPAGATARVDLRFRTHGDVARTILVKGRLFLSQNAGGSWRIFGYDVSQGAR
jgi:hypothetical protein